MIANALWPLVAVVPVLYVVRRAVIDREEAYLERLVRDISPTNDAYAAGSRQLKCGVAWGRRMFEGRPLNRG
jgi:hypothetical protein